MRWTGICDGWPFSDEFTLSHAFDHMIIDDPSAILATIQQAVRAELVDQMDRAAGDLEDLIQRGIREDVLVRAGIEEMSSDIGTDLGPFNAIQLRLKVDALPDRCV